MYVVTSHLSRWNFHLEHFAYAQLCFRHRNTCFGLGKHGLAENVCFFFYDRGWRRSDFLWKIARFSRKCPQVYLKYTCCVRHNGWKCESQQSQHLLKQDGNVGISVDAELLTANICTSCGPNIWCFQKGRGSKTEQVFFKDLRIV